ncbi:MAG: hypothetical protein LC768_10715, partial [Acidobacteria bacterium]|nr:hypothetical protein [Acidobacteriota bacterium]
MSAWIKIQYTKTKVFLTASSKGQRCEKYGSVAKIIVERRGSRTILSQAAIRNNEATNFACPPASLPNNL